MNNRNELKPRKPWSDEEDNILRSEIARQGGAGPIPRAKQERVNDWRTIATKLPGRSNKDCRKRWMKLDGSVNKGSWSEEEDQRLRKAVRLHLNVWTEVARVVETRHADQCAKRWLHFLNPELDHSRWTEQDDERLWAEVERGGRNWRKIVDEVLEGRSATDAKNRYTILQRGKLNSKTATQRSTGSGMDRRNVSNTRKRSGSRSRSAVGSAAVETQSIPTMDVIKDELNQSSFANEEICLDNSVGGMIMQQLDAGFDSLGDSNFVGRQPDDFLMIDWEPSSLPREGTDISNLNFAGGQYSSEESMNSYPDMSGAGMDTPANFLSPIYFQSPGCFGFESPTQQVAMSRWSGDTEVEEDDDDKDTTEGEADTPANQLSQAESGMNNRRSTIVLEHMQPDLVGQILTLLLSSNSKVEVKIISQDEWPVITQGYIADGQWGRRTSD